METASSRRKQRRLGARTGLAALAVLAVVVVALVGWASYSGRLASLQYANVPVVHPYPPAGYFVNPFTNDPRDLVSKAGAEQVRSDFLRDGQIELDAFSRGDPAPLAQAETGMALTAAIATLEQNTRQGVVERDEVHLDSVTVGLLADPNNTAIRWCVREVGNGALVLVSKTTGQVKSRTTLHFDSKYWLVRTGGHYLYADVLINVQLGGQG